MAPKICYRISCAERAAKRAMQGGADDGVC